VLRQRGPFCEGGGTTSKFQLDPIDLGGGWLLHSFKMGPCKTQNFFPTILIASESSNLLTNYKTLEEILGLNKPVRSLKFSQVPKLFSDCEKLLHHNVDVDKTMLCQIILIFFLKKF